MASDLEIVTLAVAELTSEIPESLTSPTGHLERTCAALLPFAFRETLQASKEWTAARRRVALNHDAANEPAFGYLYQYALPAKLLTVRRVVSIATGEPTRYRWEREGRKLLTDDPGPIGVSYIAEIAYTEADPLLAAAAAARLAWRAARSITDSAAERERLEQSFWRRVAEAQGANGAERQTTGRGRSEEAALADIARETGGWDPVEASR